MSQQSLGLCINKSLQLGHMHPDLPNALLTPERNKARNRTENKYWDYKAELSLNDAYNIAEFAKDVLAFHNTDGGMIAAGISDHFAANGIAPTMILDTKKVHDRIRKFVGDTVDLFQDSIEVANNKFVWLIFIPKYQVAPACVQSDGPYRSNRPTFSRGQYFFRDGDEVKVCRSDSDVERIFRGIRPERLSAYNYEIDEPFFRLLDPNCERFVGRREKIEEIKTKLELRQPIVALDGLGGVGKTAVAIEAVRELFNDRRYLFIISVSAKSKVWVGHVRPRQAAFAGLHGLLSEIASVIPYIEPTDDTEKLKRSIVDFMKGQEGLILVDNLEEIDDRGVLKFLSEEVPEPVKILVTSRIAKDLGALTISVPGMSPAEAEDLLKSEFERLGLSIGASDVDHVNQILAASGGVPLAIKWAAQIAAERRSLREASSILRGAGASKQELLSFCFATMYDALSDTAKKVACLIPYLNAEWKPMSISIALNLSLDAVRVAIFELADKGIIYPARQDKPGAYGVLPLAREFLSNKWHESHLQQAVDKQLSDMFASDGSDGFLLDWPISRRLEFCKEAVRERIQRGEYDKGLKLVRYAISLLDETENSDVEKLGDVEISLRFLEGLCLYNFGNRAAGLAHMGQAFQAHRQSPALEPAEVLEFADALFAHGGSASEKEASECVFLGLQVGGAITQIVLERFLDCNLKRGNTKLIADVVFRIRDGTLICAAFDRIGGLLKSPQIRFTYEKEWASALNFLAASDAVPEQKKLHYLTDYADIRERFAKSSLRR